MFPWWEYLIKFTENFYLNQDSFLLCNIAPVNLFGRDLFSNLKGPVHFASSGDLTLKFPDQLEPDYLCSLQSVLDIKEEVQHKFSNLMEMPANLGATSDSVNIRRIKKMQTYKDSDRCS